MKRNLLLLTAVALICAAVVLDCDGGGADAGAGDGAAGGDGGGNPGEEYLGTGGGAVTLLRFAAFGDVQPRDLNDDDSYPAATIKGIITQAAAHKPNFMAGIGDYIFADDYGHAVTQMDKFLAAEEAYPHTIFHGMGNHECTGYTKGNCPDGDETGQVQAYYEKLLTFSDTCYFRVHITTSLGSAKIVFVCANGWSSTQEQWLQGVMEEQTKYTFVVRHEPPEITEAPGVSPSESIIKKYRNTLHLYGHLHEYRRLSTNEVISGNAGAPLAGDYYGYLMIEQLQNGNVKVTERQQGTDAVKDSFTLTPDGQSAD